MTNVRKSVYRYDYRRSGDQDAGAIVRRPVVVVGAGPVGLATAIDLAVCGKTWKLKFFSLLRVIAFGVFDRSRRFLVV